MAERGTMASVAQRLADALGPEAVRTDPETLTAYASDWTEELPREPQAVAFASTADQVRAVLAIARAERLPLTARVAGTNIGGLAIPARGGIVLDLTRMKRLEIDEENLLAVLEPGVTFGDLSKRLAEMGDRLIPGYPFSPPEASVMANCIMDGLSNLSALHGPTGEWIGGLEVLLPTGETLRTGAAAFAGAPWFARSPLPDLTGLFLSFQGTTGIVLRLALQLWPAPRHRRRAFFLFRDRDPALTALRDLGRSRAVDDVGALSWVTGRLIFGIPAGERDPAEPEMFVVVDVTGETPRLLEARWELATETLARIERGGAHFEGPLGVDDLVRLQPGFAKFASFPTRLDFLLDHPGGGLTWVGTYGPFSRFREATDAGLDALARHGFPPLLVSRSMKGGHFGVLRLVALFDKKKPDEVQRTREAMRDVALAVAPHGFIPYKTPPWAIDALADRIDPTFLGLVGRVQRLLDPDGILNPGKWRKHGPGAPTV